MYRKFWDKCHTNIELKYLSGCRYLETVEFLQVKDLVCKYAKVLEVGVGVGHVTKGLYNKGAKVSALDISNIALLGVKKYCENTYNLDQLSLIPKDYFDLIIMHNVIQHIPTPLLKEELKILINSLKVNGVLSLEFVSSYDFIDTWEGSSYKGNLPGYYRSIEFMKNIIKELGGVSTLVVNNKCYNKNVTGCHVLHIRKSK